jgi:hypothetical protein
LLSRRRLVLGALLLLVPLRVGADAVVGGECSGPGGSGPFHCLYRSLMPSTGIVADCRNDGDCRIGYYYGEPEHATWFVPPSGMTTMPRPEVIWLSATFAEARIGCGRGCSWSYFFEARRRQLSPPRRDVLQADQRRLLMAQADGRALAIRQIFSGREVLRIERDWAPGLSAAEAITQLRFEPDGRLSLTWLGGPARTPVAERVTVPSLPR